jgi:hypothetical protein
MSRCYRTVPPQKICNSSVCFFYLSDDTSRTPEFCFHVGDIVNVTFRQAVLFLLTDLFEFLREIIKDIRSLKIITLFW